MFSKSEGSNKLKARKRLLLATRLQAPEPSFRLCSSSSMPSAPMNDAQGSFLLILMRECTFHLTTFVLRNAWANRHYSRHGFILEELANQSILTCGIASNTH
jgi:hypothetical protein